jgi:hypothetical protein
MKYRNMDFTERISRMFGRSFESLMLQVAEAMSSTKNNASNFGESISLLGGGQLLTKESLKKEGLIILQRAKKLPKNRMEIEM